VTASYVAFCVGPDLVGVRLDRAMRTEYPNMRREEAMRWLRARRVERNGLVASYQDAVQMGDVIVVKVQGETPSCRTHAPLVRVPGLVVVDKRPGVAMHEGIGVAAEDALTAVLFDGEPVSDPHDMLDAPSVLGRLDRPTSGIVVAAMTRQALASVLPAWQEGRVQKQYAVVVHGHAPASGDVDVPLAARRPRQRGHGVREEARTSYVCLAQGGGLSLLCATLHTGRMHQIRRHMKAIGHAVVGDDRYGHETRDASVVQRFGAVPLCLHAWRLTSDVGAWPLPSHIEAPVPALWALHGAFAGLVRDGLPR
jgi:23S rRNA-/tRNA-specific pseudouridylate synthase